MATSVDPQDLLRVMEGDLAPLDRVLTTPYDQLGVLAKTVAGTEALAVMTTQPRTAWMVWLR
jgi:hypothetical protein